MTSARVQVIASTAIAALLGGELLLRAAHLPRALTLAALVALAAAAFSCVVFFHMNLRAEPRAVKVVIVLPLVLSLVFVALLVADALVAGIRP